MFSHKPLLWLLVAFGLLHICHGHSHMMQVLYGDSANLTCDPHAPDLDLASYVPGDLMRMWILPHGEPLDAGTTDHPRVKVLQGGAMLHVPSVDDEDFGLYFCLVYVYPEQRYLLSRHGINVHGAYWGDLYELKYKGMLQTGLIAGAVAFACLIAMCFAYNRFQTKYDKISQQERAAAREAMATGEKNEPATQKPMTQYTNTAYVPDDVEGEPAPPHGAQKAVTQYTSVAYAEEVSGGKKAQAPAPPFAASAQGQATELRNVAAAETRDGEEPLKTKL